MDSFVHLHNHSEYSMLDGAAKIRLMFEEAQRMNMPAIGITDHGNMFGASEFYTISRDYGIKPIIGIEAYVSPGSRFDMQRVRWGDPSQKSDDVSGSGAYTHMTLLAENEQGLRNLFILSSRASLEGQLSKYPRMDADIIAEYHEGIIATTGCPSGEVQTRLRLGQYDKALESAAKWRDIFGRENYFLEVMDHGLEIERRIREDLLRIGKELDIAPLATNDCHYVLQSDAESHGALLCVQTGKTLSDPTRFKFDGDGFYLKTSDQMRRIWDSEVPSACDSTLLIAQRVQSYENIWKQRDLMPQFPVQQGYTLDSWLCYEVKQGLIRRFAGRSIPEEYTIRAEYELGIIVPMGFSSYFLIVADLVNYAKKSGIRVGPGRGSAAGSLVAWALGIINVDPMELDLIFERFLNPDRISMPDIDIDFDDRRRGEMIRYASDTYGSDKVAQVITFGTIKTKAALKDAARVLYGQSGFAIADKITKVLPPAIMAKDISLSGISDPQHERYKEASEVRALIESDSDVAKIYETALGLEGLIRNAGVHACAVIMSSQPLSSVIPIWKRPNDGAIITGWDWSSCEAIGLLKMDFLGLRNLTVIGDCVENIKRNRGIDLDIESLSLDDPAVYQLLSDGTTLGVFQLDSGPMRDLLRRLAPKSFEDIMAVLALYRPGPMAMNAHNDFADRKNGRQKIVPIHPELAESLFDILKETYGLIVYQEQIMRIAQTVAGYSLARADILRSAMGKKKEAVLKAEFDGFAQGMAEREYSQDAIQALWDTILPFAGYAFNKSHAAGYAMVSYWTAYLKANYPAEYMAALLTAVGDDKDKAAIYLADCRHLGIKVLPPDVNESVSDFASVGKDIRFGLASVRNVGIQVVQSIIATREEKGKYSSFSDYLNKIDLAACTKKVIESLAKAGAFDSLGHTRKGLYLIHTDAVDSVINLKKAHAIGQFDLFESLTLDSESNDNAFDIKVPDEEWDNKEKLAIERQMLGLYVTGHPLEDIGPALRGKTDTLLSSLIEGEIPDNSLVTVGGILSSVTRKVNKNGTPFATAIIEDISGGMVETYFFPNTYARYGEYIVDDGIMILKARVNNRDDKAVLISQEISLPDFTVCTDIAFTLVLPIDLCTEEKMRSLRTLLKQHKGEQNFHIALQSGIRSVSYSVDKDYSVHVNPELIGDLKHLFGSACFQW